MCALGQGRCPSASSLLNASDTRRSGFDALQGSVSGEYHPTSSGRSRQPSGHTGKAVSSPLWMTSQFRQPMSSYRSSKRCFHRPAGREKQLTRASLCSTFSAPIVRRVPKLALRYANKQCTNSTNIDVEAHLDDKASRTVCACRPNEARRWHPPLRAGGRTLQLCVSRS